jgi:anti-sigma regulatory factor (Ser/Thr protein kinase)
MVKEGVSNNGKLIEGDHWSLETNMDLVLPTEKALFARAERVGWNKEEVENFINYAVHEALFNAFGHGNLEIPSGTPNIELVAKEILKEHPEKSQKKVKVTIEAAKEIIKVTIQDEGKGFDPRSVPDPTNPENLLKFSGRGSLMMRGFSDSVVYEDGGRRVTLIKKKAA